MQGDLKIAQVTINQISTKTESSFSFVNFWLKVDSVSNSKTVSSFKRFIERKVSFCNQLWVNGEVECFKGQWPETLPEKMLATAKVSWTVWNELPVAYLFVFLNRNTRGVRDLQGRIHDWRGNGGGEWAGRWRAGKSFPCREWEKEDWRWQVWLKVFARLPGIREDAEGQVFSSGSKQRTRKNMDIRGYRANR